MPACRSESLEKPTILSCTEVSPPSLLLSYYDGALKTPGLYPAGRLLPHSSGIQLRCEASPARHFRFGPGNVINFPPAQNANPFALFHLQTLRPCQAQPGKLRANDIQTHVLAGQSIMWPETRPWGSVVRS